MDTIKSFDIRADEIAVDPADVCRALGYSKSSTPQPVMDKVKSLLSGLMEGISPRAGYVMFADLAVDVGQDAFSVGNVNFSCGSTIASQLKGSDYIAAVVATAGPEITEVGFKHMAGGELLEGYIADTIGSLVAEQAADIVEKHFEMLVSEEDRKITNRLSPGYCGWDVAEQHKLFSLLPDGFCGVRLNESALMIPIKSISAVVGIGRSVEKGPYPCSICNVERCYMRK
jgi:hypothetical protein